MRLEMDALEEVEVSPGVGFDGVRGTIACWELSSEGERNITHPQNNTAV